MREIDSPARTASIYPFRPLNLLPAAAPWIGRVPVELFGLDVGLLVELSILAYLALAIPPALPTLHKHAALPLTLITTPLTTPPPPGQLACQFS